MAAAESLFSQRPDLLEALKQSCLCIESARAKLLAEWGSKYSADAENVSRRAEILQAGAPEISLAPELVSRHLDWLRDVAGRNEREMPLGPALVARLSEWTNKFATSFLGQRLDEFSRLGEMELRMPTEPSAVSESELVWESCADGDMAAGECFVIMSDTHIGSHGTGETLAAAVNDINTLRPEFVLVAGDITDDGEPGQFEDAARLLSEIQSPTYCVLGNHDAIRRTTSLAEGHALFTASFSYEPLDRVLTFQPPHGQVTGAALQVALIDTTDPIASPVVDWDLAHGRFRDDAGGTNGGALREGQAETLAAKLDPALPALIVGHHELQPFASFPPVMFGLRDSNTRSLLSALAEHQVNGFIAGHTHRSALSRNLGFVQLEIPSMKDWPYCFAVCRIVAGGVEITLQQISDRELVMRRAINTTQISRRYTMGATSSRTTTLSRS